jgi:uncharacterized membrane protein YgcG
LGSPPPLGTPTKRLINTDPGDEDGEDEDEDEDEDELEVAVAVGPGSSGSLHGAWQALVVLGLLHAVLLVVVLELVSTAGFGASSPEFKARIHVSERLYFGVEVVVLVGLLVCALSQRQVLVYACLLLNFGVAVARTIGVAVALGGGGGSGGELWHLLLLCAEAGLLPVLETAALTHAVLHRMHSAVQIKPDLLAAANSPSPKKKRQKERERERERTPRKKRGGGGGGASGSGGGGGGPESRSDSKGAAGAAPEG